MENKLETADKKVLVDIVKLAQKRGLEGNLGGWKEFLKSQDKKFGSRVSDPSKRPPEILVEFLKTFSKEEELKFFDNIMQHHSNQHMLEQLKDESHDSPEQRLVQATLRNPLYPLDYSFKSIDEGWIIVKLKNKPKVMKSTTMVAVDCEMVLCKDGTEALVQVCVVDHNLEVKLNELIKPDKEIADYRTEITGVSSQDLEAVTCSLADIQKRMKKLLSSGTILVGHSLHNDLQVLKLEHVRVIDTSYIFQPLGGSIYRKPSLNSLCQAVLGCEVREEGAPHNCLDDARAAMNLVLAKIKHGVDREFPIASVQELVPENEMAKLLLHNIPITVDIATLHKIIPGDFKIELKPSKKVEGANYAAFAIFKTSQEAAEAYENVYGRELKDTSGRPQKLALFQLNTGVSVDLYIRKMLSEGPNIHIPSKRALQMDEVIHVSKKAKMKQNENEALNQRLKQNELEIESLRKQLTQKDFEISMLHKMVSSLRKRNL